MNWQEHLSQAEMLLKEAEQEAAMAQSDDELTLVAIHVSMARAHTDLAAVKRVLK
jgi:hypothetical protein